MLDNLNTERRLSRLESRTKSNTYRINELREITSDIHELAKSMAVLVNSFDTMNSNIEELKSKVDTLESAPAKSWKESTKTIINTVIAVVSSTVAVSIMSQLNP